MNSKVFVVGVGHHTMEWYIRRSVLFCGLFISGSRVPSAHSIRGWPHPSACLDAGPKWELEQYKVLTALFLLIKPTRCTNFSNLFWKKLYMFRTVPLSIVRSFSLYTQQWYKIYRFSDSYLCCSFLFVLFYVLFVCKCVLYYCQQRSWLRHCATSWKVAGSISDGVIGIFHWHNPSGRTMALGPTQPLTEMSTRNVSGGVKAAGG